MAKRYTPEQKKEILAKVQAGQDDGLSQEAAIRAAGIGYSSFSNWTKEAKKTRRSRKAKGDASRKKTSPQLLSLTLAEPKVPLVILMGQSQDVKLALDRLAQIHGAGV
jgi:transposase-like protein